MQPREFRSIVSGYEPTTFEISQLHEVHYPGMHWLQLQAYRYFRALNYIETLGSIKTLVDIGCFPGTLLRLMHMLHPATRLYGVGLGLNESFRESVPEATLLDTNLDPDVYFEGYHETPTVVDVADGSVDLVTAMEIVEHLYSPLHLLREACRLLQPGGTLYLTTNNVSSLPGILRALRGDTVMDPELHSSTAIAGQKTDWRGHVRFWSGRELREMLAHAGFSSVRVRCFTTQTWYPNKRTTTLKILAQRVLRVLGLRYGTHLECVAHK